MALDARTLFPYKVSDRRNINTMIMMALKFMKKIEDSVEMMKFMQQFIRNATANLVEGVKPLDVISTVSQTTKHPQVFSPNCQLRDRHVLLVLLIIH